MRSLNIPAKGFLFLKKLKKNNRRDWFLENKESYEKDLREPLKEIVSELGVRLRKVAPEMNFDPKRSIFRINRDVRFSANKEPYKTNLGAAIVYRHHNKKDEYPGLYLHVEPGNCFIGGGLYMPSGDQLRRIRHAINKDPQSFLEVISSRNVKKYFGGLAGEKLKGAPRGIAEDHPSIELLKYKQFIFVKNYDEVQFQTGNVAAKIEKEFVAIMPLIHWLNKALVSW